MISFYFQTKLNSPPHSPILVTSNSLWHYLWTAPNNIARKHHLSILPNFLNTFFLHFLCSTQHSTLFVAAFYSYEKYLINAPSVWHMLRENIHKQVVKKKSAYVCKGYKKTMTGCLSKSRCGRGEKKTSSCCVASEGIICLIFSSALVLVFAWDV
jgi:hypothetical protein